MRKFWLSMPKKEYSKCHPKIREIKPPFYNDNPPCGLVSDSLGVTHEPWVMLVEKSELDEVIKQIKRLFDIEQHLRDEVAGLKKEILELQKSSTPSPFRKFNESCADGGIRE